MIFASFLCAWDGGKRGPGDGCQIDKFFKGACFEAWSRIECEFEKWSFKLFSAGPGEDCDSILDNFYFETGFAARFAPPSGLDPSPFYAPLRSV